jgi:hypothetical protein
MRVPRPAVPLLLCLSLFPSRLPVPSTPTQGEARKTLSPKIIVNLPFPRQGKSGS